MNYSGLLERAHPRQQRSVVARLPEVERVRPRRDDGRRRVRQRRPARLPAGGSRDVLMDRRLGLAAATSAVAGQVIAVGIFLTPASMARTLASPAWLFGAWLLMGGMALAGALSYGELAARYPEAGGGYVYLREAYGRRLAFLYGWKCLLVMDPGITAALASGLAAYVALPRAARSDWIEARRRRRDRGGGRDQHSRQRAERSRARSAHGLEAGRAGRDRAAGVRPRPRRVVALRAVRSPASWRPSGRRGARGRTHLRLLRVRRMVGGEQARRRSRRSGADDAPGAGVGRVDRHGGLCRDIGRVPLSRAARARDERRGVRGAGRRGAVRPGRRRGLRGDRRRLGRGESVRGRDAAAARVLCDGA